MKGFVALLLAGLPVVAHAQPGEHIRAGDAVITPSLSTGVEYRTNVYRAESDTEGGADLRIGPQLEVDLQGSDVEFGLSGQYEIRKYFGELVDLDRYDNFDLGFTLSALPEKVVGIKIEENATLRNNPVEVFTSEDPYTTQLSNDLQGALMLRPGTALEFGLGGLWSFDDYRVPTGSQVGGLRPFNRKNTFGPTFEGAWEFFPRTAFVVDAEYMMVRWQDNLVDATGDASLGGAVAVPDADLYRVLGGMRGRVSSNLVLVLMAGYGGANYDEASVLDDVDETIDQADVDAAAVGYDADLSGADRLLISTQARYSMGVGQTAAVGYSRNFQDAFFTNYVTYNYISSSLSNRFGSRVGTDLEFGVRFEDYAGEVDRTDIRLVGKADVTVNAADWAQFTSGVWWNQRASTDDLVEYDDFNIHLLATLVY